MQNTNIMPAVSQLAFKIFCANLKYFLHQGNLVAGAKLQAPSLKHQAPSGRVGPQASSIKLLRRSLTRALIPDIVGVRVRPEMARQSIYVEVHLWARAIAPPRSCSNDL